MAATAFRLELARLISVRCNKETVKLKGVEAINTLRVVIELLRQAEKDYLSPGATAESMALAIQTLFGIHQSPLPLVCKVMGIDVHAARLKLLEWKLKKMVGDPIFGFLNKPGALDKFEKGEGIDVPCFRKDVHGRSDCDSSSC